MYIMYNVTKAFMGCTVLVHDLYLLNGGTGYTFTCTNTRKHKMVDYNSYIHVHVEYGMYNVYMYIET